MGDTPGLDAFWMPFTANREYKAEPRLLVRAKGIHYYTSAGAEILDGTSGIWCCNAGHARESLVEAIARQAATLDFCPSIEMAHPLAFEFSHALTRLAPGFDRVFLTSSGSEGIDTAIKIALAYHAARGEQKRTLFVGRERGYHGSTIGAISVGGHGSHRALYRSALMPHVLHIPSTHDLARNAYSRGQPQHGLDLANEFERRLVALHDPYQVAALIVEPIAGTTGVLIPPVGYLERLREICTQYGILLIYDEVMTGFGRLGEPFAYQRLGATPDLIVFAKAATNATVPCGGVLAPRAIYDAIINSAKAGSIEFAHGFTYSGHPLACAAGLATLKLYEEEQLLGRVRSLEDAFETMLHSLRGEPYVKDIRNLGFVGAVELEPRPGQPRARARDAHLHAFATGVLIRYVGDTIALAPPLIADEHHLSQMIDSVRQALRAVA